MQGALSVKVYFEYGCCADLVAMFQNEETYEACLPELEKLAKKWGATISEAIE
jgi:hypothetical protein